MKLVLVALLVVAVVGERQKRTLGLIFRGLVDANMRTTPSPKKEPPRVEKLKGPPPATIYLIPVPERDKKSEVQVFNTPPPNANANSKQPVRPNFVTPSPPPAEVKNATRPETKQFLIRITNEEGKSIMLRITGDDLQVKKKGDGYMIGVSHNEAKANIGIELPKNVKNETTNEIVQSKYVDKYQLPFSPPSSSGSEKYEQLGKGVGKNDKPTQYPFPQIPPYPYPVFFPSHYFPPVPFDNPLHSLQGLQYPFPTGKSPDSQKHYLPPTKRPAPEKEKEATTMNTTTEGPKPVQVQLTVRVKGEPVIKETVAEVGKGTKATKPKMPSGFTYLPLEPRYQEQPGYATPTPPQPAYQEPKYPDPRYLDPKYSDPRYLDPKYSDPRYLDPKYSDPRYLAPKYPDPRYPDPGYQDPSPQQYQWYQQYLQPPQQQTASPQQSEGANGNWNFAHYTPYPSYLQDTLAPPYLPTGYGRSSRAANTTSGPPLVHLK